MRWNLQRSFGGVLASGGNLFAQHSKSPLAADLIPTEAMRVRHCRIHSSPLHPYRTASITRLLTPSVSDGFAHQASPWLSLIKQATFPNCIQPFEALALFYSHYPWTDSTLSPFVAASSLVASIYS